MLQGKLQTAPACQCPGIRPRVLLVLTRPTQSRHAAMCRWHQHRLLHSGEGTHSIMWQRVVWGPLLNKLLASMAVASVLMHVSAL
jgi:hypothetical protein